MNAEQIENCLCREIHFLRSKSIWEEPNDNSSYALDKNPLVQTVSLAGNLALKQTIHAAIHYVSHLIAGHVTHSATGYVIGGTTTAGAAGMFGLL